MDTKTLPKFLFFNGERVNELGLEKNSFLIREAIHHMLGLNLLKQTIEDLEGQNVLGKFRRELKENTSAKKRQLLEELEKQEKNLDIISGKIKNNKDEIVAIEEQIKNATPLQKEFQKAKEFMEIQFGLLEET